MGKRNKNILKRIAAVQRIVKQEYEPENQRKSQAQVFRKILVKDYPMSERTFRRYMKVNVDEELVKASRKRTGRWSCRLTVNNEQ